MKITAWTVLLVSTYLTACHTAPQKPTVTRAESPPHPTTYHSWEGDFWDHSVREGLVAENNADAGSDGAWFPSGQQLNLRERVVRDLSAEEPLYYAPRHTRQEYPLDGIRMQSMHPDRPSPYGAPPEKIRPDRRYRR